MNYKSITVFEYLLLTLMGIALGVTIAQFAITLWDVLGNNNVPQPVPSREIVIHKLQFDNFSIDVIDGAVWAMGVNTDFPDYDNLGCDYIYPDINDGTNNCGIVDRDTVKGILEDNNLQYGVSSDLRRNY